MIPRNELENKQEINNPFSKKHCKAKMYTLTPELNDIKRNTKASLSIAQMNNISLEENFFKVPNLRPVEIEILKESSSYLETISAVPKSINRKYSIDSHPNRACSHKDLLHIAQNLPVQIREQLFTISSIPLVSPLIIESLRVCFPEPCPYRKTAVIDLDETLISTHTNYITNSEPICAYGEIHYVRIRPGAVQLLESLSKHYEIIIFTASQKEYADKVISVIDKKKTITYALYRDSVVISNKQVVKDLRILYRNLKDVVLIDNCAICMAAQPENGILVRSYNGEERDIELDEVKEFLLTNAQSKDLREEITRTFKIKTLSEFTKYYKKELLMDA